MAELSRLATLCKDEVVRSELTKLWMLVAAARRELETKARANVEERRQKVFPSVEKLKLTTTFRFKVELDGGVDVRAKLPLNMLEDVAKAAPVDIRLDDDGRYGVHVVRPVPSYNKGTGEINLHYKVPHYEATCEGKKDADGTLHYKVVRYDRID